MTSGSMPSRACPQQQQQPACSKDARKPASCSTQVFCLLSAVLWLGNVGFWADAGGCAAALPDEALRNAACLLGVPAAIGLVRGRFTGKPVVSAIMRAPPQIPHVVTGIALLQFFYAIGDFGGMYVQGTSAGLFLGHLFMATPFVIGSVVAVLQRINPSLEEAACVLGASPWRAFRRVTLPLIIPGVFTGALYAFIVSFVDVPVAIFLASPNATTFPVELFNAMEQDFNPSSLASASLAAAFAIVLVFAAQRLVGLDSLLKPRTK